MNQEIITNSPNKRPEKASQVPSRPFLDLESTVPAFQVWLPIIFSALRATETAMVSKRFKLPGVADREWNCLFGTVDTEAPKREGVVIDKSNKQRIFMIRIG